MIDGPACASGQLCHHIIAVAEQCNVKVDVVGRFARNVDLRHFLVDVVGTVWYGGSAESKSGKGEEVDVHLGDGGDLHGCADHDDQVDYGGVVLCQSVEEAAGKLLAEESDVGLQQSVMGASTRRQTRLYLHHAGLGNVVASIVFGIRMARSGFRLAVGCALALSGLLLDDVEASLAERDALLPNILKDDIALDLRVAFAAACGCP